MEELFDPLAGSGLDEAREYPYLADLECEHGRLNHEECPECEEAP